MARPSSLSAPASALVLSQLRKAHAPMTAYALLDRLKEHGINSAPIIYRALDVLVKDGSAHKIRELGAYIACNCPADHRHALSVLTVCGQCQDVRELHDHGVIHQLEALRNHGVALSPNAVIELPVTCAACAV